MGSKLNDEAIQTFVFISDCEYSSGLIGLADMMERHEALDWLVDGDDRSKDPRPIQNESQAELESWNLLSNDEKLQVRKQANADDEPPILEFIPIGLKRPWCFTVGDPDNYPSVPHGHLNSKDQPWPKLNPYTGRAFNAKDFEELKLRLSRKEMVCLWNNKDFCDHARKQIAYYSTQFPHHKFPVPIRRIFRLPRRR